MKQPTSKGSSSSSVGSGKNDHPDGFKSKRKRHVDKDPELLKRLEAIVASGGAGGESRVSFSLSLSLRIPQERERERVWFANVHARSRADRVCVVRRSVRTDFSANNELRFHFADLTEKFLVPLNRYFASLIPTDL